MFIRKQTNKQTNTQKHIN